MRICHFTNTFLPHVGGVARAVQTLLEDQRRERHRVLVVAPEFAEGTAPARLERSVARLSALKNFNGSDFSVSLPFTAVLNRRLADFPADILHAHHPFLLGDAALREAAGRNVPLVFTHHTLYEHYSHYLPIESPAVGDFAAEVATRFANRCDAVIAPSGSVRDLIVGRGVTVPVYVLPTGIDMRALRKGQGERARARLGIPAEAVVLGHLGRLAEEKNLAYLADALARTLRRLPAARVLIVGDGPAKEGMEKAFAEAGVAARVLFAGKQTGSRLRDACAAMDLFAFSSLSETQGLVLAEAMASGTPVVALDAPGVRDVVVDRRNGRLLSASADAERFARALAEGVKNEKLRRRWSQEAQRTAAQLDRRVTSEKLLEIYEDLIAVRRTGLARSSKGPGQGSPLLDRLVAEGQILADKAGALVGALAGRVPSVSSSGSAA